MGDIYNNVNNKNKIQKGYNTSGILAKWLLLNTMLVSCVK